MIIFNYSTQKLYRYAEICRKIKTAIPVYLSLPLSIVLALETSKKIDLDEQLIKYIVRCNFGLLCFVGHLQLVDGKKYHVSHLTSYNCI